MNPIMECEERLCGCISQQDDWCILYGSSNVNAISSNVNGIGSNVNGISSNVNSISRNVNGISGNVNGIGSDVNGISSNINGISSNVNSVNSIDDFSSALAQRKVFFQCFYFQCENIGTVVMQG